MPLRGLKMLAKGVVNAVTFELTIGVLSFTYKHVRPYASSYVGPVGTVLFLVLLVVSTIPDPVGRMTKDNLVAAFVTLLKYLLPWIVFRLLLPPSNRQLCVLAKNLFSTRCQRLRFYKSVRLIFEGLCLGSVLYHNGLPRNIDDKLIAYWRRTLTYRLCCGGAPPTVAQAPPQPPPQQPNALAPPQAPPQQPNALAPPAVRRSQRVRQPKHCYLCK